MSEFESFLKNFDDDFEKAEATGFTPLPDGKYQARVDTIRIEPNKKTNELALRMDLVVAVGEHKDRKVVYYKGINEKQIPYLKADLARIGVNPEPFSKIESYFPGVLDKILEVEMKTSKPGQDGKTYSNLYINKTVGTAPDGAAGNAKIDTSDLPF